MTMKTKLLTDVTVGDICCSAGKIVMKCSAIKARIFERNEINIFWKTKAMW